MDNQISDLIGKNKQWSDRHTESDPEFFKKLSLQQKPKYLWIGCADSRVPATQLVDLAPGEMFVHRNVSNLVVHTDLNCLSVIQYAVEVLKVEHIIVCGHYGCGGIQAAYEDSRFGLIDNWLRHVQDIIGKHRALLDKLHDNHSKLRLLCELNVIEQACNVSQTTIVQQAWENGQKLVVNGLIYGLEDGKLNDLDISIHNKEELEPAYHRVLTRVTNRVNSRDQ